MVQIMPNINMMMAIALMACITFRLKLVGRLGSFFLKKYIYKYMGKKVKGVRYFSSKYL